MQSSLESFHRTLNGRAITLLAAVIAGIYLGASTISEIDPFYRSGQARSGDGSYTIDGWRGADAVRPPAPAPVEAPVGRFGMAWVSIPPRELSGVPIDSAAYAPDPELGDAISDDRAADCADCSEIVEPAPEALPADCAIGDPACAPEGRDSEEAREDVPSAQPVDF